ncbi:hypothetical protein WSK_1319 [Novosphingobium sp. Rr 2-17]|uniref:hypothetical protein n=1 Tax=Novosphingobium sp. Rr 2-17 TaxID=555793 RepID=UPI00026981B1|nr:hypothetical protein [Novosphingobium sp. Rr 2-17]EIZ79953.1 hypothetical protein WSK_1319 [Novosphingobium sp. Rr 2-17]
MSEPINVPLNSDEIEMLVDALEIDLEGYIESASAAKESGNREDVQTFTEAAKRIQVLKARLEDLIED